MIIRRGITLIEQLISIAVLGILVLIVTNIFISVSNFSSAEQNRIIVGENASRVLSTLDKTLREGRNIIASANVNGTDYYTSGTTLVMNLPSIVSGANTTNNDVVVVTLDQTNELLNQIVVPYVDGGDPTQNSTRPGGTFQLTSTVKDVYFRYNNSDPTAATGLTAVIRTQTTVNNRPWLQTIILNETLRNNSS